MAGCCRTALHGHPMRLTMHIDHDPEGDVAMLRLAYGPAFLTWPLDPLRPPAQLILDFCADGRLLGIEVLGVSDVLPRRAMQRRSTWRLMRVLRGSARVRGSYDPASDVVTFRFGSGESWYRHVESPDHLEGAELWPLDIECGFDRDDRLVTVAVRHASVRL